MKEDSEEKKKKIFNPDEDPMSAEELEIYHKVKNQDNADESSLFIPPQLPVFDKNIKVQAIRVRGGNLRIPNVILRDEKGFAITTTN